MAKISGWLGILSVALFACSLLLFGFLNPEFSFTHDYISRLGAKGEPYALWWNINGFILVGFLLTGFGFSYGKVLDDKIAGMLLALFGIGFAFTAIPINMADSTSPVSKAHVVAICLALACWLFGLSRVSYNPKLAKNIRARANITALLLVCAMIGFAADLWSMAITHRLVFGIVFGWTGISAFELLAFNNLRTSG